MKPSPSLLETVDSISPLLALNMHEPVSFEAFAPIQRIVCRLVLIVTQHHSWALPLKLNPKAYLVDVDTMNSEVPRLFLGRSLGGSKYSPLGKGSCPILEIDRRSDDVAGLEAWCDKIGRHTGAIVYVANAPIVPRLSNHVGCVPRGLGVRNRVEEPDPDLAVRRDCTVAFEGNYLHSVHVLALFQNLPRCHNGAVLPAVVPVA
mmetsp:Transcript_5197/g.13168  ORF Transcript_5197/g.13168 Transcript_5197/m.13168 type:complete len:204 (-) Transcript_5197:464-1075(-)